jgi:tRNA U38,U39,U40 pseudouridine synthase TruA
MFCRSFRARHDCCTRTYNYLLPAAIIGIQADTSPLEVEERVEKFQSILGSFEVIFFFNLCQKFLLVKAVVLKVVYAISSVCSPSFVSTESPEQWALKLQRLEL